MIKKKILFFILVFLVIIGLCIYLSTEKACFLLSKSNDSKICYVKSMFFNKNNDIRNTYEIFVNQLNLSDSKLDSLVYFSDDMLKQYGDKRFEKIREYFSWLEDENYIYAIEGVDFAAILLNKKSGDNYVLYFDIKKSKFYFDYETQEKYLPINKGWVNNGYESEIKMTYMPSFIWPIHRQCLFQKDGVILYTNKINSNDGGIECDFGQYQLIQDKQRYRAIKANANDLPIKDKYTVDKTMIFMEWISNK